MIKIEIEENQLLRALELVSVGLEKYMWIQASVRSCKPSEDSEFQRRFNGFYRVRRNDPWRVVYFGLLQEVRDKGASFKDVLTKLTEKTGRVEASFSSKLFATVYPDYPVIDSIVLKNLNLRLPASYDKGRVTKICGLYAALTHAYEEYLKTPDGKTLVKSFQNRYPRADISKTKMLDLVLWQSRDG